MAMFYYRRRRKSSSCPPRFGRGVTVPVPSGACAVREHTEWNLPNASQLHGLLELYSKLSLTNLVHAWRSMHLHSTLYASGYYPDAYSGGLSR